MFFKSKKVIGLDIGSNSLKLIELDVSKSGATINNFRLCPTPPGSINEGEILDPASLSTALRGLVSELGSRRKRVCTGIWGMAVIVKKITMPRMDKKLLEEQIQFEAEQYIPFDISNVSIAHSILSSSGSGDTMDILLIAAQNEIIGNYNGFIDAAGLDCKLIDVNGFALANCFELNYGKFPQQNIGLINIGASVTNFVVVSNGEIVFCRDVSVGGNAYTSNISKSMGVSLQEAEMLKLSAVSRQEVPDDVVSLISSTNDLIAEEIRNSLDFLSATNNGMTISRCFVTGGASSTTGLLEAISRSTGINVESLNPFLKVKVNSKKMDANYVNQITPIAAIAVGLGMRQVGDS